MSLYQRFAHFYHQGPYIHFSRRLADEIFPNMLKELNLQPKTLLDVACGEGTFAVAMAQRGLAVTGLDQSKAMLEIARLNAQEAWVSVRWIRKDMCKMRFEQQFEMLTCFFDSLNYLLKMSDLKAAFDGAFRALKPGGTYIFDMNTIYGLEVEWQKFPYYLQQERPDFIEFHANQCDYENAIASVRIIIFEKQGESWQRFEEVHRERGYGAGDVHLLLEATGFEVQHIWGNPSDFRPLSLQDGRMWVVASRPE